MKNFFLIEFSLNHEILSIFQNIFPSDVLALDLCTRKWQVQVRLTSTSDGKIFLDPKIFFHQTWKNIFGVFLNGKIFLDYKSYEEKKTTSNLAP